MTYKPDLEDFNFKGIMGIEEFDVFVIGSGVAGQTVAEECVKNNLRVAITDHREFGGTCANRGCDPKKIILGITEIIYSASNMKGKGIAAMPEISWKDIQKYKNEFTDPIPASTENKLRDLGIKMYHQSPVFISDNTLSVEGKTVKSKIIVIASGLTPRPLTMEGSSLVKTSDDFLEMESLPESMIFIGAGYIGMEFAHIAARFGVEVTVIDSGERPLSVFDKDMVQELQKASEELGITFIFDAEIDAIEDLRKNKRIHYSQNGEKKTIKAETIFNTTGRIPSIQNLDLKKGNISYSDNGIIVNSYLQNPENKSVYACGDVSDNALPLTPFSTREAKIVAANILKSKSKEVDFPIPPSVAFTLPNVASVGLSEKDAKAKYNDVEVICRSASSFFNAKRVNEKVYAYKTIINKKNNKILGAHLVGPEAGEIINLFAMAIYMDMTTDQIKDMIFTYPSWGGDISYML